MNIADLEPKVRERIEIDPATGCHVWTGMMNEQGYGIIKSHGRRCRTHRISYVAAKGEIPQGLILDHLCRNRACCNPDHLEAVTRRENTLRGEGPTAQAAKATHCPAGHPYEGSNLAPHPKGYRQCRICRQAQRKFHVRKSRARRVPSPSPDAVQSGKEG